MSKLKTYTFLFIFLPLISFGQAKVTLNDISKIKLVDGFGGFGVSSRTDYEVVNENGQWVSYLIHEKSQHPAKPKPGEKIPGYQLIKIDSTEHKLIKTLREDSIRSFLTSISVINPKFDPANLGITVGRLTRQINEKYFAQKAENARIFDSFFDSKKKLYKIITDMQNEWWTDDNPYNTIIIYQKNGDSTKIETRRENDYMLPWKINNTETYDIAINQFFIYATFLKNHRMGGAFFLQHFYDLVDFNYARFALGIDYWRKHAPENVKYIEQYGDIVKVIGDVKPGVISIHPKGLDKRITVGGFIDMMNKSQIERLCRFATDTLSVFFKNKCFVIDSCMAKEGCSVNFPDNYGEAFKRPFFIPGHDYLKELNLDQSKFILFNISVGPQLRDFWTALPDGNFLLTDYFDDYPIGVLPAYIKTDGYKHAKLVFKVFSAEGKLLKSYYDP